MPSKAAIANFSGHGLSPAVIEWLEGKVDGKRRYKTYRHYMFPFHLDYQEDLLEQIQEAVLLTDSPDYMLDGYTALQAPGDLIVVLPNVKPAAATLITIALQRLTGRDVLILWTVKAGDTFKLAVEPISFNQWSSYWRTTGRSMLSNHQSFTKTDHGNSKTPGNCTNPSTRRRIIRVKSSNPSERTSD